MKRDSLDELFENIQPVKAPDYFTQKVMDAIEQLHLQEISYSPWTVSITHMRRLGVSMIAMAILMFSSVFLPIENADLFHHTVQAQTQMISEKTDKVSNLIYNPVREFNKFIEDCQKKIDKMKEEYHYDR